MQHLESARDCKQSKEEYLQILSELNHMGVPSRYDTIELSVFGHYLPSTLTPLHNTVNFFIKKFQSQYVGGSLIMQQDFQSQLQGRYF